MTKTGKPSKSFKQRVPLEQGKRTAETLKAILLKLPTFTRVDVCGSIRRCKPDVGDIDMVVDGDLQVVRDTPGEWRWVEGGASKATLDFYGTQVNLLRSDDEHWGAAIFYFTGPHDYNIAYRRRAKGLGLLLNEKGLFGKDNQCIASRTEHEIYRALGKLWKRPEERGA